MADYRTSYTEIIGKLNSARRTETVVMLSEGLFKTLTVISLAILGVSLIELAANGDESFRTVLAGIVFASGLVSFGLFMFKPLMRAFGIKGLPGIYEIALRVGNIYPEIKDRLCNAIQLISEMEAKEIYSKDLILASFHKISINAENKDFSRIVDKSGMRRSFLLFFIAAFLSGGLISGFTGLGEAAGRVANFNRSFVPPAPFTLSIEPKVDNMLRGDNAFIKVKASGQPPESVDLYIKESGQENYDVLTLKADTSNYYIYKIKSLKQSLVFYAEAEWMGSKVITQTGRINVSERPMVRTIEGVLNYPPYTGMSQVRFTEQNADISALRGSSVNLNILTNKNVESAKIIIENFFANDTTETRDTSFIDLNVDGKKISGGFRVSYPGSYYIELTDADGLKNADPIKYTISALSDDHPRITMLQPLTNVTVNEDAILPMRVSIQDDFGFSGLKLHYRLLESKFAMPEDEFTSVEISFIKDELSIDISYVWDLNEIGIAPEDKYEFYLEVADNDIVSGPKKAKTATLIVRLPSLEEVMKESEIAQDNIQEELRKTLKESQEVRKDMEELNRELLKKKPGEKLDWKEKKQAEDIMKKQSALNEKMENLSEQVEQTTQKLQENNMLSQETLEKYMELQDMMRKVDSKELREMQRRMQQAMEQMDPEQLRKAMENVKFDEDQFRQNIERTMNILKRLQAEQKTDALQKRAEELLRHQEELQKQMENTNPENESTRDELAKKQDQLSEEVNKINNELKELENTLEQLGDDTLPMEDVQKAMEALNNEQTSSEMQQASQKMKSGNFSSAKKNQQNAKKNLQQFTQQMQKLKQNMQQNNSKMAMQKMQKAIADMLELSTEQENLKDKTQSSNQNSNTLPDLAKEQARLSESLVKVANSMAELAQKSFSFTPEMGYDMGMAMKRMRESTSELGERRTPNASRHQQEAMALLNDAINKMRQRMQEMQQNQNSCPNPGGMGGEGQGQQQMGQNGMGFQQRLQQMAAEQQALNQSMMKMSQGRNNRGQLSQEQQAKMARLANKQGRTGKSMEELVEEQKQAARRGERKDLGDLEKLADEMKEVVKDMQSGGVSEQTIKRQERILSRLLDASRSIHERDFEKKREAKTAEDFLLESPDELDLSKIQGRKQALEALLRSIRQDYSKDYENLIRRYFEALQNGDNSTNQ